MNEDARVVYYISRLKLQYNTMLQFLVASIVKFLLTKCGVNH